MKRLKVLKQSSKKSAFLFFISCFTVPVIPIISFISLFEINKLNPFPALRAPFPLIFLSNLTIAFEVQLLTNPGKLSLAKGIAIIVSAFFPKLPNHEPKNPPDWIILDI